MSSDDKHGRIWRISYEDNGSDRVEPVIVLPRGGGIGLIRAKSLACQAERSSDRAAHRVQLRSCIAGNLPYGFPELEANERA